jgi:hypothetical protein
MITHPEQYAVEQARERERFLRSLTPEHAARLLESLLTSGLLRDWQFTDHRPTSLAITIARARQRV